MAGAASRTKVVAPAFFHVPVPRRKEGFSVILSVREAWQRYHRMRQVVAGSPEPSSAGTACRTAEAMETGPAKCALGGLIVLWTARAWQTHPAGFPCRLRENL
jgi:hypothetical protein